MTPKRFSFAPSATGAARGRLGLGVLFAAGMLLGQGSGLAQETAPGAGEAGAQLSEEQIQDWTVVCGQPAAGPEQCEMRQQTDRVVTVVGSLPGRTEPGMLVFVPLGILLPAGVTLQVDGGQARTLQVQRCVPESCQVELVLEEPLLSRMKSGSTATFTYAIPNAQGQVDQIQGEISLLGFTAALDRVLS